MGGLRTLYTVVSRSEFALKIEIQIKKREKVKREKVLLAGKKYELIRIDFFFKNSVLED